MMTDWLELYIVQFESPFTLGILYDDEGKSWKHRNPYSKAHSITAASINYMPCWNLLVI